jgi:small subunit ribosomal protein S7
MSEKETKPQSGDNEEKQATPTPKAAEPKPVAQEQPSSEKKPAAVPKEAPKTAPSDKSEPESGAKPPAEEKPSPKPSGKPETPAPQAAPPRPPAEAPKEEKPAEEKRSMPCQEAGLRAFNRWDMSEVKLSDAGMARYINLDCMSVPRTGGKYGSGRWTKDKMPLVERFMNRLQNTGHRGKKHKISSGNHAGKIHMLYKVMKESLIIIEKRTKKNPIQVLVEAVENSGPLEEVASYRLGGIIARNSVVTSPQRRLDLALRHLTQGIFRTSFRNRKSLANVIAEELIAASQRDAKCFAIMEKNRLEKESEGAR